MSDLKVFPKKDQLIETAAQLFVSLSQDSIKEKGSFSVALSGGSTPLPLYKLLTQDPYVNQTDWKQVHFFWGDERTVPPNHPESNFLQAYQHLLEPLGIPDDQIHRIKGELEPSETAHLYHLEISSFFPTSPPQFDLILLGMGDDGHTASLFPGTQVVSDPEGYDWVAANFVPQLETWRITFTPQLINAAARVIFLVAGEDKKEPLYQVIKGPHQPEKYPSQLVQAKDGVVTWLVDQAAAQRLNTY